MKWLWDAWWTIKWCAIWVWEYITLTPGKYEALGSKLSVLLNHATGGVYSKATYRIEDMCHMVDEYIEQCCDEAVEEGLSGIDLKVYAGEKSKFVICAGVSEFLCKDADNVLEASVKNTFWRLCKKETRKDLYNAEVIIVATIDPNEIKREKNNGGRSQ